MNIKLSYLLLMNLPKATSVLFSGSRSNTEQIKEDLESLKASGKLTALNMECIEKESNFAVNVVKPEQMLPPTADAVANATAIAISSTMTEKKAPEIRRGIIKHELTHSNFRIQNKKDCEYGESGHPYCKYEEKSAYKDAYADFNDNLNGLEKRLLKGIKNDDDIKTFTDKDQKIINALQSPIELILPPSPFLLSLRKEEVFTGLTASPENTKRLSATVEQEAYEMEFPGNQKATAITLKYDSPIAQALSKINQYKERLANYPKERLDIEQPAFAVQYFEEAIPNISEKYYNFLHNALSKCTEENNLGSYVEKVKASKGNNNHLEL